MPEGNAFTLAQIGVFALALIYALKGVVNKQWVPYYLYKEKCDECDRVNAEKKRLEEFLFRGLEVTRSGLEVTRAAVEKVPPPAPAERP